MRKLLASAILAVCSLYAGDLGACGSGSGLGFRLTRGVSTSERLERAPAPPSGEGAVKKPAAPAAPAEPAAPAKPTAPAEPAAPAKPAAPAPAGAGSAEADGQVVFEFADSILSAGGFGPCDATIRLRPRLVRPTVVPPRLSFIGELLRDIESL